MGGTPKAKMRVTQYSASVHYGICYGPIDNISRISVQEKEAWAGAQSVQGSITISDTQLFGGHRKEGGVEGIAEYLPGGPTQTIPEILAAKAGRTTATMPAYRGIASVWFYGRNLIEPLAENSPGFYWGANNPYLPGVWIKVSRTSEGLGGGNARIGEDSNPAHIIYECLTNASWGMGASPSAIDIVSFTEAAVTLTAEVFGLSLIWTRQSTIESFVSEILDHIEAVLYVSPRTGLLTLKLIRDDYSDFVLLEVVEGDVCEVTWWQTTFQQGVNDQARMGVAFLDSSGVLVGSVDWSAYERPDDWEERTHIAVAPAGSASIRLYMEMKRNTGTNNDGYIDDISLTLNGNPITSITNPGAELGTIGWTNETGGLSLRASDPIPHTGVYAFMGGTSSLTRAYQAIYTSGIDDVHVFTPDNSVVSSFSRKLWGETINEIVVTWTNPESEEEETVVAQDLANISMQGGIVSDGRNYYGVRNSNLAMQLAQRDLRAASMPLASCDIEVNREAWDLEPGDICILNSPEDGIDSVIMRVGPVDYGKPGDAKVRSSLVEDVFSLGTADYTEPPSTDAESTSEAPTPVDFTLIITASWYDIINDIEPSVMSAIEYPEVFAGVLASEDGPDTIDFDLFGEVTDAAGNISMQDIGTKTISSRSELPSALVAEVETIIDDFGDRTRGNGPVVGGFVLIEGSGEDEHELCLISASGGSPTAWTLRRGVLDTIPRAWPIGTPIWFISDVSVWIDQTVRSEAESVDYQILPRTSLGRLSIDDAPIVNYTLTGRPHLPSRPANVTVNSDDGFSGIVDLSGVNPIPTSWSRRNRLTEDSVVLAWDDGDVTPEAGQTTVVRLLDISENVLHEYTGISGTSQNVDPDDFMGEAAGYIEFVAQRDGNESLQGYRIAIILADAMEFEDGEFYEFEDGETKIFED